MKKLDRLRYTELSIIDFEFIEIHPEAKLAIWERYNQDSVFRRRIDEHCKNDLVFNYRFYETFKSYLELGRGR